MKTMNLPAIPIRARRDKELFALVALLTVAAIALLARQATSARLPRAERSLHVAAQDWSNAFAEKNHDRVSDYFAENVVAMYPLDPLPTTGQERNWEVWESAFHFIDVQPVTTDTVVVAGSRDVGYSFGRWAVQGVPERGKLAGRYLATWAWTKAGWRITYLSVHLHQDFRPSENQAP